MNALTVQRSRSYIRMLEADGYLALLKDGKMTTEEVARVGDGDGIPGRLSELAASAAGITRLTYQRAKYITDKSRAETEIKKAKSTGGRGSDCCCQYLAGGLPKIPRNWQRSRRHIYCRFYR